MALPGRRKQHGNTKHHVKKFNDAYDGQSAYLWTVWGRLKGLTIDVSPVNQNKVGLNAEYRVSIHKDENYRKLTRADWQELRMKESEIRNKATQLSRRRLSRIKSSGTRSMTLAEIQDFERDAPELYRKLPRNRKNIRE